MASKLDTILSQLNDNGQFRASLFSTSTGLVLASKKIDEIDDRIVAAMGTLLSDAATRAAEEMGLSEMSSMKIKYRNDYIVCRNIILADKKTQFILAVLTKPPESDDIDKYFDQLLDWAVQNGQPELEKLSRI
jgi:predicted regulator of Ras-like GTPase activity (Roadblock/LC7/MglB family)